MCERGISTTSGKRREDGAVEEEGQIFVEEECGWALEEGI